jgi:outer membrane protein
MMKKVIKLLLGIALIFAPTSLFAQQVKEWTLSDCINYALENNIQIKRFGLQTEIATNTYQQSKMQMLPNLNAGGNHSWNFGRNIDKYTNEITNTNVASDNFYLQSSVNLFSGFQTINSVQQNRYLLDASLQDYERAKNDISLQIATVFLQVLQGQEALGVAQKQFEVTHMQLERVQKLFEVGNKAKGDLLEIQAQEANDKYNITVANNNLHIAYLTLAQLLELKSVDDFKIKIPDTVAVSNTNVLTPVEDIYKEAETKLPQIKSAESQLKSYEKSLEIIRGQQYPTLTLTGTLGTGYSNALQRTDSLRTVTSTIGYVNDNIGQPVINHSMVPVGGKYPFFTQLSDNQSKSLVLNLNIPIFNQFQVRRNIKNAKVRAIDASYNLQQSKKSLYQEIQKAHADAAAAFEQYNSANEAVIANEELFKYNQQKYDVGMISSVDFNIVKNTLTKAKSDLIQAKYLYIFKIKVLDFYKGVQIVL